MEMDVYRTGAKAERFDNRWIRASSDVMLDCIRGIEAVRK